VSGPPESTNIEKQMLIEYVVAWNELASAYRANQMFSESLEAYQTAIQIYQRLNMKMHQAFASGDYHLS
jgi:hypothetical protein